jgi:membrane protein implicated in regulation of membrane protease activity
MGLVIGTILSFLFLDPPWRYLVLVPLAGWEAFEIWIWLRWRRVRSITGSDALVGATGRALTDCAPVGQVRVKGQIWKATCPEGVEAGTDVVVTSYEGLKLTVARRRS